MHTVLAHSMLVDCWLLLQRNKLINIATNIPVVSLKGDALNVCKNLQPLHTGSSIALKMDVVICAPQTVNSLVNPISLHDAPCFANSQAPFLFVQVVCSQENPG